MEVEVRVTDPGEGQRPALGVEFGWACGEWVWLLEPPVNGTGLPDHSVRLIHPH